MLATFVKENLAGAAVSLVVYMDHLGDAYSGLPFVFRGFRTLEDTKAALGKLREASSRRVQRSLAIQRQIWERGGDLPEHAARVHRVADKAYEQMYGK